LYFKLSGEPHLLKSIRYSRPLESLILFKRHGSDCAVNRSSIPHKKREFWFDCDCPVWIRGRMPSGDIVPRQSTGFRTLAQAEAFRDSLLSELRGDDINGPTVAECVERYLTSREPDLDARTLNHHRLALGRLQTFLEAP
jgi:hypothetical protein